MAQLTPEKAAELQKAAKENTFEPLAEGVYHVRLKDVDTTGSGRKGPYWRWEFVVLEAPYINRRLWNNTSLSKEAAFKMEETYAAFGTDDLTTDTDEFIGEIVKAVVSQRTIQEGNRKGQIGNNIDRLMRPDEDFEIPAEAASALDQKAEDIF